MPQGTKPLDKSVSSPSQLRESAADRVSSLIVALLVLVGGQMVAMLFIWSPQSLTTSAHPRHCDCQDGPAD